MKCIQWVVVCVLLWLAWTLFRLGTATDIQPGNELWFWLGLPVTFALPAVAGYNCAMWHFYHSEHPIRRDDG